MSRKPLAAGLSGKPPLASPAAQWPCVILAGAGRVREGTRRPESHELGRARLLPSRRVERVPGSAGASPSRKHETHSCNRSQSGVWLIFRRGAGRGPAHFSAAIRFGVVGALLPKNVPDPLGVQQVKRAPRERLGAARQLPTGFVNQPRGASPRSFADEPRASARRLMSDFGNLLLNSALPLFSAVPLQVTGLGPTPAAAAGRGS